MSDLNYIFDTAIPKWNICVLLGLLYVFELAVMAGGRFFNYSKKLNIFLLVALFGLISSDVYNIIIPGTLLIINKAVLAEHHETNSTVSLLSALHEEEEGDDVEFGPYFRLMGVSICVGFMFLYIFDYIAQQVNKKYLEEEYVHSPLVEELEKNDVESHDHCHHCHDELEYYEEYSYSTQGFLILFGSYFFFTGFGIGPLLAIGLPTTQVLFIFLSVFLCSTLVLYTMGKNISASPISDTGKFWVTICFPMIPAVSIAMWWGIFLLIPNFPPFVASLGYTFFSGMTIFLLLAFYMPKIHCEDSILLSIAAAIFMALAYPLYLLQD